MLNWKLGNSSKKAIPIQHSIVYHPEYLAHVWISCLEYVKKVKTLKWLETFFMFIYFSAG